MVTHLSVILEMEDTHTHTHAQTHTHTHVHTHTHTHIHTHTHTHTNTLLSPASVPIFPLLLSNPGVRVREEQDLNTV